MNTTKFEHEKQAINSYLTFKMGDELFAVHVSNVLNILELTKITKVPQAPAYMKGVINLRGSILPLIDTRIKFGMTETAYTTNTCILVLEIHSEKENIKIGALVDSVQEVLELSNEAIVPPPSIGNRYKATYIEGMAKIMDDFVMILNVESIFSGDDVISLQEVTDQIRQSVNS
jgi:purine-binding chemotaxis protein CheW